MEEVALDMLLLDIHLEVIHIYCDSDADVAPSLDPDAAPNLDLYLDPDSALYLQYSRP